MFKILTLNKIAQAGLKYLIQINMRFQTISKIRRHYIAQLFHARYAAAENLLAIARAGAGVNNIPVEKCSKNGIVVFNTLAQMQMR